VGQPGEFGDGGVGAVGQPAVEGVLGADPVGAGEDQPQVLGGDPGSGELLVGGVAGVQAGEQPRPGAVGVVLMAAAQQPADPEQRIIPPAAVPGEFLLDAAADVVDGGEAQPDDVEGVEHAHRVRQRGAQC
jgi:hypothetical protein